MSDLALRVDKLSKLYSIRSADIWHPTLRDRLARLLHRGTGKENGSQPLWALKDLSFEVKQGDAIGVIGRNGAGKSTLLKILSRITEPTEGKIEIHGRVASLLEVGTGFHPELSGRENIYLNAAILGMKRTEIEHRLEEIVAFAEVDQFLETPVKHYSSGMYVRLAFSVAAHMDPDILLVDEVLAVGDAAFQKKCLGRMNDVARTGRTVVFVSHNLPAVESLCTAGMVLKQGKMIFHGSQSEAIAAYLADLDTDVKSGLAGERRGTGDIRVTSVEFRDSNGSRLDTLISGMEVDVCLNYEIREGFPDTHVIASIMVKTPMDQPVFLQHNRLTGDLWNTVPRKGTFVCRLKRLPLPASIYRLGFSVMRHGTYLDGVSHAVEMVVQEGDFYGSGEIPPSASSLCLVEASWRVE